MTVRATNTTRANRARAAAEAAKKKTAAPKRSLLEAGDPDGDEPADDIEIDIDDSTLDARLPPAAPAPKRRAQAVAPEEEDGEDEGSEEETAEEAPTKEFVALRLVKLGVDTFFRRGEQLDVADKKLAAELLKKRSIVRVSDLPRYRRAG